MRRRRRNGLELPSVNLTPLLDVVLQLITFFMILIHFGSRLEGSTRSVRLPVTPAALPGGDLTLDRLTVAIDAQGQLLTGDTIVPMNAADAWWRDQAALRREGARLVAAAGEDLPTIVVLRGDKDAPYGAVRDALARAQKSGFAHFSLVVLRSAPR